MADLPVACTLSPDAMRARRQGLLADLLQRSQGHELTADGLRVIFSADGESLATIAQVVDAGARVLPVSPLRRHGRA
jgi:hypothetical protein